jgi:hypothetical protein
MSVDTRIEKAAAILGIEPGTSAESLADLAWLAGILSEDPEPTSAELPKPKSKLDDTNKPKSKPPVPRPSNSPISVAPPGVPPEHDGRVEIFSGTQTDSADFVPAALVSIPAADALSARLAIERALKPFLKRFPSPTLRELDLAATVEASAELSAELRVVSPVFRPVGERWFDVVLLVEKSEAMELWSQTIRELHALMERHGAFRTVRTLFYEVNDGAVVLTSVSGQPVNANSVADPDGRRLCLLLTHGVSFNWGGAPLQNFVRSVGRNTVLAIVQMLPQRLWSQTALGTAADTVYSVHRASPNAALRRVDPLFQQEDSAYDGSSIPLLTLQPGALQHWARFVMEPRRILQPAVSLQNARSLGPPQAAESRAPIPDDQLAIFRAAASPLAFQLLRALAYVPLTLPVMKLLQQSLNVESDDAHLAEILLSGLIDRLTPRDAIVSKDQVLYDFAPGVRELLLQTLSSREIEELENVMRPARERLREYVERKLNSPVPDFMALIGDPDGLERLPAEARPFLEISRRIYEMRGVLDRGSKQTISEKPQEDRRFLALEPRALIADTPVEKVVVSGRGKYIASLQNGWIQLWDAASGLPVADAKLGRGMTSHILAPSQTDTIVVVSHSEESDGSVGIDLFSEGGRLFRQTYRRKGKIAPFIFPDSEILGLAGDGIISLYTMTYHALVAELPKPGKAPSVACAVRGHVLEEAKDGALRLWKTV